MNLKNYLLISGLIFAMVFTSCKKEEEEEPLVSSTPPQIEMNGKTSGSIVEVPQNAANANNGQFNSVAASVNAVGPYLSIINNVPETATTSRSTNAAVTYYWTASVESQTAEYWYTVEESGANYNIELDIALTDTDNPDFSFARTSFMSGWVSQDGANGHLVINFNALTGQGDFSLNYVYDWDTNAVGDFHVVAEYNIGADSQYANILYEATVYADGHGEVDYTYTDGTNNVVWHYDWNAGWTIVNWSYSLDGGINFESTGQWTA